MAMGILAVFDMAGIDVGVNVHRAHADKIPARSDLLPGRLSRCMPPGRLGQKSGQGVLSLSGRATAPGTTIRRRSRSCAPPPSGSRCRSASTAMQEILERCLYPLHQRGHPHSRGGRGDARRATSTWSGARATAFRAIAAARCSTPTAIGLKTVHEGMLEIPRHVRAHALAARAVARAAGRRGKFAQPLGIGACH